MCIRDSHGVQPQMPPEVVGQLLRTPVQLPFPEYVEAVVVHYEDPSRSIAVGCSKSAGVDSFRAAMNSVRRGVSGARGQRFRLDHLYDLRFPRIGLGIDDVDTR